MVKAQQVINRLAERSIRASRQPVKCRLRSESLRRRGNACSACTVDREFELDQVVAAESEISDQDSGGSYQERSSDQELIADK